jgi:hypothetical protein
VKKWPKTIDTLEVAAQVGGDKKGGKGKDFQRGKNY